MTIKFQAITDIVGGAAATLVWDLQQINTEIRLINKGRIVNGKSLVGIISANIRQDDIVTVVIDNGNLYKQILQIIENYGRELI